MVNICILFMFIYVILYLLYKPSINIDSENRWFLWYGKNSKRKYIHLNKYL